MRRVIATVLIAAGPAPADVTGPGGPTVECYCTDSGGDRVELGQTICLQVDGRTFTAQCQMSLNVPMWRETGEGCVSSGLTGGQSIPQHVQPPFGAGAVDAQI